MTGFFGSLWRTDLILRNPDPDPLHVTVKLLPNPGTTGTMASPETNIFIPANGILVIPDALGSLFSLVSASGALLLTPEAGRSVEATSRTYNTTAKGTYGMGVGAVDFFAAVGARFALTFSAGLLGDGFRTNVVVTDTSGRGADVDLQLASDSGFVESAALSFTAPSGGQAQLNGLSGWLGTPAWRSGSFAVAPRSGEAIAGVIAIDNITNDPTYFPPDLPAPVVRTVPALVHSDGVNGAKFKTDLYLYNPADRTQTVLLAVKAWDKNESESILNYTLLPHESKTIHDAYFTAFGRTGVGRLRYQSGTTLDSAGGVRVTSRTYTTGPDGGTYGHLVPPLNSFQSAGSGESLSILGPTAAAGYRTNLALVDLSAPFATGASPVVKIEVIDDSGAVVDHFETTVPLAGGVQLNDLFRARGLREDLGAVLLRISPSGGLVAAYATTIDNGTNDPVYFAANLAAR
jgi:hypothetical protein